MAPIAEEHIRHRRYLIHSAESFIAENARYGMVINKKLADEKGKEIVSRFDGIVDSDFSVWTLYKCAKYCLEINKVKMSPTTYNDYQVR